MDGLILIFEVKIIKGSFELVGNIRESIYLYLARH